MSKPARATHLSGLVHNSKYNYVPYSPSAYVSTLQMNDIGIATILAVSFLHKKPRESCEFMPNDDTSPRRWLWKRNVENS